MKKFLEEFKTFISRGNVMDMAVGVIIGGAFSNIVTSLVDDIINPILGIFGGINFDQLSVKLAGDATLNYGKFITAVINFLIMALIIFIIVKTLNKAAEKFSAPKERKCLPLRYVRSARARFLWRQQDVRTVLLFWKRRSNNESILACECLLRDL